MNVLVTPNLEKDNAYDITSKVITTLLKYDITPYFDSCHQQDFSKFGGVYTDLSVDTISKCDCIIAIGGDGTILHSAKLAINHNIPLLGINAGRLGFLSSIDIEEIDLLSKLKSKQYSVVNRMLINIEHHHNDSITSYIALNEASITYGAISKMIDLDLYSDSIQVAHYRSDGIIVSTPSGSTAYALSAGGPIIDPSVNCILVVPVCSHSLFQRPLIFSESSTITISPSAKNSNPVYLTVDGDNGCEIFNGDKIVISKATVSADFININNKGFSEILNNKFQLYSSY